MLNHFSFLSYRPFSFRTVATVGAVLLALAFALCLYMASKVQKSVVTTIDSIEFHDLKSISIGEHSDVCYSNVPQRFLIVEPTDEGFAWHVNEQYHDSLQYFKINNENPNRHEIRNSADQKLTTTLRNSHAEATFSLSGADIWEYCKRFDDQKDIPLHLFAPEGKQLGIGSSASFIHIADGSIALVILDERTQLTENGTTVSYTRSGTASADGDKKGHCKVQFFNVSELTTLIDDSVRHFLRTSVKLTEWGAGHVMLSKQGVQGDEETASSILVNFPKPITFVASADSLRKVSQPSSQTITLKQNNNAFPSKSDIFLPASPMPSTSTCATWSSSIRTTPSCCATMPSTPMR